MHNTRGRRPQNIQRSRTSVAAIATLGVLAVGVLAACANPATVEPAPHASDPVCAQVLQSAPSTLDGQERRSTTAQSALAWGDPAIVLRCGAAPIGPTTEPCVTVGEEDGQSVDWVMREPDGESEDLTLITYGREPAIELLVPSQWASADQTSILLALVPAVSQIPQTRECL